MPGAGCQYLWALCNLCVYVFKMHSAHVFLGCWSSLAGTRQGGTPGGGKVGEGRGALLMGALEAQVPCRFFGGSAVMGPRGGGT